METHHQNENDENNSPNEDQKPNFTQTHQRDGEEEPTSDQEELDPNYYKDKESPEKTKNSDVDYNRTESPNATEGVEPNRGKI